MKTALLTIVIAAGLAVPLLAQNEPPPPPPARPDPLGGQPGRGLGSPLELARRLADTLNLTSEQRPKFDALVEKFRPKWEARAGDREKMRELSQQMREARQNGDEAKAAEVRKQLDELREAGRPLMNEFLKEVEPLLTPEQVVKLNEFREQMDRGRGGPGGGLEALLQRLPDELKLTAEQRPKFEELAVQARTRLQEIRALQEELRKVRQEGNTARVTELEKRVRDAVAAESVDVFLAKVEPLLTDEQKTKLPELWLRFSGGAAPEDVRTVLQAARRLTLTEDQQTKLREITREAMRASRADPTPEKRAELASATKSKIVAILDATQAQEFERALQRGPRPPRGDQSTP